MRRFLCLAILPLLLSGCMGSTYVASATADQITICRDTMLATSQQVEDQAAAYCARQGKKAHMTFMTTCGHLGMDGGRYECVPR